MGDPGERWGGQSGPGPVEGLVEGQYEGVAIDDGNCAILQGEGEQAREEGRRVRKQHELVALNLLARETKKRSYLDQLL